MRDDDDEGDYDQSYQFQEQEESDDEEVADIPTETSNEFSQPNHKQLPQSQIPNMCISDSLAERTLTYHDIKSIAMNRQEKLAQMACQSAREYSQFSSVGSDASFAKRVSPISHFTAKQTIPKDQHTSNVMIFNSYTNGGHPQKAPSYSSALTSGNSGKQGNHKVPPLHFSSFGKPAPQGAYQSLNSTTSSGAV